MTNSSLDRYITSEASHEPTDRPTVDGMSLKQSFKNQTTTTDDRKRRARARLLNDFQMTYDDADSLLERYRVRFIFLAFSMYDQQARNKKIHHPARYFEVLVSKAAQKGDAQRMKRKTTNTDNWGRPYAIEEATDDERAIQADMFRTIRESINGGDRWAV